MSKKRQKKQHARAKRFIFELSDFQNEMFLTNVIEDNANFIYTVINSIEDFVNNAIKSPEK